MTYQIGQKFTGTYPPTAAIWCNENNATLIKELDTYTITDLDSLKTLEEKKQQACDIVNSNYNTYCEQGLSFTYETVEYTIDNDKTTRDESAKKLIDLSLDIQSSYDWTMDSPRTKIEFSDKATTTVFLESLKAIIASNETLLRDKKTAIDGMTLAQVNSFIATPVCPTYGRTL